MAPQGKRIGDYRIVEALGTGGLGTVFRAHDEVLNRFVAIKVIRHDQVNRAGSAERFQKEAAAVAAVHHPYLVNLFHLVEWEDSYGLVMELVEGVTLASRLEDGPLEVSQAVRVLAEVAEGLSALHEGGIVHRDLKPANVMLTGYGHTKLMDFGLAQFDTAEGDKGLVGTPSYMSPEQALENSVDPRSDLFSLGVLAYESLTGVRPFAARSVRETLTRVLRVQQIPVRERRPEVPAELSDLVDHLLEKKPVNRPESAREVLAVLGGSSRGAQDWSRSTADPVQHRDVSDDKPGPSSWAGQPSGTASAASLNGTVVLAGPVGLGWADLAQWIRFAYYQLRPSAAYRRHAELVDKCFQQPLQVEEERELARLEAHLDRLEAPHWKKASSDLIRLRDELKAHKTGD